MAGVLQGSDASIENIERCLSSLSNNKGDILFFCYTGHGGKDEDKKIWPVIWPPVNTIKGLSGASVVDFLLKKRQRMKVILFQACNRTFTAPMYLHADAVALLDSSVSLPGLKELFVNYEGSVVATSSKPGELSWKVTGGPNKGAIFFTGFVSNVLEACLRPTPVWGEIFEKTASYVKKATEGTIQEQHPYWQIHLTKAGQACEKQKQITTKKEPETKASPKEEPSWSHYHHRKRKKRK